MPITPGTGVSPRNRAACVQYERALYDLDETIASDLIPIVLQINTYDGEKAVREAAEPADEEARRAMEHTASALAVLGTAVTETYASSGGLDIDRELAALRASVDAVRLLCAGTGSPVTAAIP